jgi:hypothetical protein
MKTFKHSGDLGDIIYSLPTMKDLGGGILYLDISGGVDDEYCKTQLGDIWDGKTKFNQKGFDFLYPLLKQQKYITDVKVYNGEKIDYNLNKMRQQFSSPNTRSKHRCLVDLHRQALGLNPYDVNNHWLECGEPIKLEKSLIISRSPRYQGSYVWLAWNRKSIEKFGTFIGLKKEHELFEWTLGIKIDFFDSNSALEIAKVIAGSKTLISNSTLNLAIAMGLKNIHIIQEMDKACFITSFPDKNFMERV